MTDYGVGGGGGGGGGVTNYPKSVCVICERPSFDTLHKLNRLKLTTLHCFANPSMSESTLKIIIFPVILIIISNHGQLTNCFNQWNSFMSGLYLTGPR